MKSLFLELDSLIYFLKQLEEGCLLIYEKKPYIDFGSCWGSHFKAHIKILIKFRQHINAGNLRVNECLRNIVFGGYETYESLQDSYYRSRNSMSISSLLNEYKKELSVKVFEKYFILEENKFSKFENFLMSYFSSIKKISNLKNDNDVILKLISLFKIFKHELKMFQKYLKKLNKSLHAVNKAEDKLEEEMLQLKERYEKTKSLLQIIKKKYPMYGTIDMAILYLKKQIHIQRKFREKIESLSKFDTIFTNKYLNIPRARILPIELSGDLSHSKNHPFISSLGMVEFSLEFLKNFKEAYQHDNQFEMSNLCQRYQSKTKSLNFEPIGVNSNLKAYAGVVKTTKKNGSWTYGGHRTLLPKHYARRLAVILRKGYYSSYRMNTPLFKSSYIPPIGTLNNMYFFIEPHTTYGGNMFTWDLNEYCLFRNPINEFVIFTPGFIPPKKLKLIVSNPERIGHGRDHQDQVIDELKKLRVKFEMF